MDEKEPTQLTVADLQNIARVIDLASSRGAFRGAELSQVGSLFDKLNTFLTQVTSEQKENVKSTEGDNDVSHSE